MKRTSLKEKYLIFKVRQNKDANAYGQLYDYYVDRIFRFILFKVATTEEAEDLTSEVFLKTWEYINNTGKKIKNLNALLYKIARNKVIDYYRTKARHAVHSDEELMKRIEDQRNLLAEIETRLDVKSAEQ
ncbi:hypothetical protein KKC32_01060, partial [Patescibacteria group bacterium]|nr:hypothetical protein [Patescibacteria group bacterium]